MAETLTDIETRRTLARLKCGIPRAFALIHARKAAHRLAEESLAAKDYGTAGLACQLAAELDAEEKALRA